VTVVGVLSEETATAQPNDRNLGTGPTMRAMPSGKADGGRDALHPELELGS
jgi:hypothetical protein